MLHLWRRRIERLQTEVAALALAYHDPRVPWYARLWLLIVLAYAFSRLDLIPDPIPILGALDDIVLIPLGVALALRMIPPIVMDDARARVQQATPRPAARWLAAGVIVVLWLMGLVLITRAIA